MKERGHNAPKKRGKTVIAGSGNVRVEKERGVIGDTNKEEEHQLSPLELFERKESISHKYVQKDAAQKVGEFPMSKPSKANLEKDKISVKKKSRRPRVDFGEQLVNLRIQVWWPMDEMFYAGTVKAFDSETKKHEVLYDDDEIEFLNLRKEKWKLCGDETSLQKQVADRSSPSKELGKTKEHEMKKFIEDAAALGCFIIQKIIGENLALGVSEDTSSPGFH
ncbi:sister chromatid cohesion protein PDS5 homolog A-like [Salvia hispanica]|uniref:sister chromatid cohesion protein PDS5 homolog A-like n=1 Tax=Salvia hispanica TaxID=49212 RepID=UPI0020093393|nr:sister chromatid cohesion protein PDS5 homolog A-like [Salvia hispanica]